jgi:polyisoprenyl-phosphate glycosyltransferase
MTPKTTAMQNPTYSFVIPVYNEEDGLAELYRRMSRLLDQLDGPAEVILVDDGSRDRSYALMLSIQASDTRFRIVQFSRNFGHQIAISAGMDLCSGEAVVIMDADLQDPPEVVLEMAVKWREGYDLVYGQRQRREQETWFKKFTAGVFYRTLRRMTDVDMPLDAGDFRLIDRKALDAFRSMRERSRYVRGMFGWIGFRQTGVSYVRPGRFAGETKYPLRKMVRLALDGIISFSNLPLRFVLQFGFLVSIVSFVAGIAALYVKLSGAYAVPGWASLMVWVSFIGGVQLTVIGVIGEYIGRIYEEVKQRPLSLVKELKGFGALGAIPEPPVYAPRGVPTLTIGGVAAVASQGSHVLGHYRFETPNAS